jgi:hypothetical protein
MREAGVDALEGRVRYDGEHRVVICLTCQSGIAPRQGIRRHLQRHHLR